MIMKSLRRGFSILNTLDTQFISAKYYINTPVGVLKALKNYRPHFDLCYFSKQNLKWSFEEIDVQINRNILMLFHMAFLNLDFRKMTSCFFGWILFI